MKTTQLFLASLLFIGMLNRANAQATTVSATNTVTATNFLGSGASSNFDVLFKRNNINAGKLATTFTSLGVNANAMANSVSIGVNAGQFSSGFGFNTYIGQDAGKGQSATILNIGNNNTFIGKSSGLKNTNGNNNTFVGTNTGNRITTGYNNVAIGENSGTGILGGNNNTMIGKSAGCEDCDDTFGNVFIGSFAGFGENTSNKLVINSALTSSYTEIPLIWGDFANDLVKLNGKVGIGSVTTFPTTAGTVNVSGYKLFVTGGILTEEVRVNLRGTNGLWADYVFNKDYNLKPLSEVENFISENGHLPNVPSAQKVKEEGIELGEMAKIQQEKIEELTLYIIEQNKINEKQNKVIEDLMSRIITLEKR